MKNKLFHILLCLLLVLSLVPAAAAATLDTADLQISGNTVIIGSGNAAVLEELDNNGKTAKIAVPYTQAEVFVVKDGTDVVPHNWDKIGFIQFEVPGAGTYVITTGTFGTLDEQLEAENENVLLPSGSNSLTEDHSVQDGTVISANDKKIQGTGTGKTLTAEGSLQIRKINDVENIQLDTGDKITFDAEGNAKILPRLDGTVGYGSCKVTLRIGGKEVTQTYFLVKDETLTISRNGKVSGNHVFAPGGEKNTIPPYKAQFEAHENTHVVGKSGSLTAHCNGLFDYYTKITLTGPGSGAVRKLAEKTEGKDVTASGVEVSKGSTVLKLKSSYLNDLSEGTYTLTFHYADGGKAAESLKITKQAGEADPTNPKTGDPIAAVLFAMCSSVTLVVAAWYAQKVF